MTTLKTAARETRFDMADTLFDERQLYALAAAIFVKGTHAPRL